MAIVKCPHCLSRQIDPHAGVESKTQAFILGITLLVLCLVFPVLIWVSAIVLSGWFIGLFQKPTAKCLKCFREWQY